MKYICDICKKPVEGDSSEFIDHTEGHIVDIIKEKHPEWVKEYGICPKCIEYYRGQIKGNAR